MATMIGYWLPKSGAPASDWEDGLAYNAATGWFAIADGASTGLNSREWAYTLARAFVAERPEPVFGPDGHHAFVAWVNQVRTQFVRESSEFAVSRVPDWMRAEGARVGAHATFLGGWIVGGELRAVAIGDCCLFRFRPGAPFASFPMSHSSDFGSRPDLVPSLARDDGWLYDTVRDYRADLEAGDVVLAASDALGEWLVRNASRPEVAHGLSRIGNAGFQQLCIDLRSAKELKNDDTTMWRATMASTAPDRR